MNIESVKIASLTADPANVRKHGERNLDAIKGSLKRFGQQKPIVVDGNGVVVAGNGTMHAELALGWKDIQVVRTELVGVEATAFAIADNRAGELAEWDEDGLAQALASLEIEDEELSKATGFDSAPDVDDLDTEIKQLATKPPPEMAWVLVGIPIERFGDIAHIVEEMADINGVEMETTVG